MEPLVGPHVSWFQPHLQHALKDLLRHLLPAIHLQSINGFQSVTASAYFSLRAKGFCGDEHVSQLHGCHCPARVAVTGSWRFASPPPPQPPVSFT